MLMKLEGRSEEANKKINKLEAQKRKLKLKRTELEQTVTIE